MWIHADLSALTNLPPTDPSIIQVTAGPAGGAPGMVSNGKFMIPTPLDLDFVVDRNSYVLNAGVVDGGDVSSQGFALLLARYPQYEHIYFNPLLIPANLDELVLDQSYGMTVGADTFYPRCQTGRPGLLPDSGQAPTATAVLASNPTMTPPRPGLLITEEIDISSYTLDCAGNPVGAREFQVYWKLLAVGETHDMAGAVEGVGANQNLPALRYVGTANDEPTGWSVWLTTDNGVTWCEVNLLEPVTMCERGTKFRLAFKNTSALKRYLAHFAVLFRADL